MAITMNGTTGISGAPLQRGTEVATTSGTTVVFATNIPDWVSRVTVMLYGVSTSGTSRPLIQFGTGGTPTYVTSGYASTSDNYSSTAGPVGTSTSGFVCGSTSTASSTWTVVYTFVCMGSNKWIGVIGGTTVASGVVIGGGYITLGAALTALRLTTVNGTDTLDAGSVNYIYE